MFHWICLPFILLVLVDAELPFCICHLDLAVLKLIKDGLVRYSNTKTSHNGVKKHGDSEELNSFLSSFDQLDVRTATSV